MEEIQIYFIDNESYSYKQTYCFIQNFKLYSNKKRRGKVRLIVIG